jgi:hypothetical protein
MFAERAPGSGTQLNAREAARLRTSNERSNDFVPTCGEILKSLVGVAKSLHTMSGRLNELRHCLLHGAAGINDDDLHGGTFAAARYISEGLIGN